MMASVSTVSFAPVSELDIAPAPVRQYANDHQLAHILPEYLSLVAQVFDNFRPMSLSIEVDPDTAETWIEINVVARGTVDNVMRSHEIYIERALALPMACPRQIRLFLQVAED